MAIPRITPYPLADTGPLPGPVVDWRPNRDRAALLVHDMQTYFLQAFDRSREPALTVVPNIRRLIDVFDSVGRRSSILFSPRRRLRSVAAC